MSDTATKLVVEWEDHKHHALAGKFHGPLDIHEVSDFLIKKLGKRPSELTIVDRVAIANY